MNDYQMKFETYVKEMHDKSEAQEIGVLNIIVSALKFLWFLVGTIIIAIIKFGPALAIIGGVIFALFLNEGQVPLNVIILAVSSIVIFLILLKFIITAPSYTALDARSRAKAGEFEFPDFPNLTIYKKISYKTLYKQINEAGINDDILKYMEYDTVEIVDADDKKEYKLNGTNITENIKEDMTVLQFLEAIDNLIIKL